MKRSGRKLLGILLTASIVAATVFPMQSTAAEEIDRGINSKAQKEEESVAQGKMSDTEDAAEKSIDTVSANVPQGAEMGEDSIMLLSYDINRPVIESFELEENGKTLTKNDTLHFKMSAYDADGGIQYVTVQISRKNGTSNTQSVRLEKSEGNLYIGTFSCNLLTGREGEYYVSQIRLEDYTNNYVEMDTWEDGQPLYTFTVDNSRTISVSDFQIQKNASNADGKLRVGDTVTYTAHIEYEGITLGSSSNLLMYLKTLRNGSWHYEYVQMKYNEEDQMLTGTYTIKDNTNPSEWDLSYIYVYAQSNSYTFYPAKIEPDKDLKFIVVNDDYDGEKPVIESITIDKNGKLVKAGETVTIKIKVNEKNPSGSMSVTFSPKVPEAFSTYCGMQLNKSTMEYTGTIRITEDTYPTQWELTGLSLSDTNGNSASLSDFRADWNTTRPWYYIVDPEGYLDDKKAPVIESITINENGQWVYPGDTVTMIVKVNEENPSSTAYAEFYPQVSYVSGYEQMTLRYNYNINAYIGTIQIYGNTYPCEWMLTRLSVSDIKGNSTELSDFKQDWKTTCPWYYRVKTDETYREDVADVTFSIYGLVPQENGGFEYGYWMEDETVKNVARRGSLKELGVLPPLPAGEVNVKWQQGWSGEEVDEDTELFLRSADTSNPYYYYYAVYDKSCVNVVLTYVSESEGIKMAVIPIFVDREATYGDVLEVLALPDDANEELFSGYKLDDAWDETQKVADTSYVFIEAEYEDCLVSWCTRYLDENGNGASKVVTKSYKKGTTISDALAALEGPEAPDGLEFESWALPWANGGETLYHKMINLDVAAIYKGKTTADVSYTYRGEDGKLVSDRKFMLLDGESLSFAAVGAKVEEALKELIHFKDLRLSGWPGTSGVDLPRYKQFNIRAQYSNYVVILKYPNGECEYVTMEKDSRYTLPVESERYIDILWEGYKKGETVTITGDKEFIVADAKLKDGTVEEPSGEKLSEEEIKKLIADIERSGSGETIHVNMKKATIVPKEVLEAIQGKNIGIVLDMGTYSWSIGGNDVAATNLKDIDLEVIVDTHVIPPSIVDSLAEGNPATQISLVHDGEFGFRADLTVNLGAQHSGSTGNLYYYDSTGKLIFRDAGEIGADGNISLSFSHASDYVVIIEKESSESNNENVTIDSSRDEGYQETISMAKMENAAVPSADRKEDNESGKPKSPKTGE